MRLLTRAARHPAMSVLALLAEVAGDSLLSFVRQHPDGVIQMVAIATFAPAMYLMSHWRSRQITKIPDAATIAAPT